MKSKEYSTNIKLLTIREAETLVEGLTEYRIRQMCLSGELPCIKAGQKHLINEQALIDYVTKPQNQHKEETTNE